MLTWVCWYGMLSETWEIMGVTLPPTKQIWSLTEVQYVIIKRPIMKVSCGAKEMLIMSGCNNIIDYDTDKEDIGIIW